MPLAFTHTYKNYSTIKINDFNSPLLLEKERLSVILHVFLSACDSDWLRHGSKVRMVCTMYAWYGHYIMQIECLRGLIYRRTVHCIMSILRMYIVQTMHTLLACQSQSLSQAERKTCKIMDNLSFSSNNGELKSLILDSRVIFVGTCIWVMALIIWVIL